jgi:hypothetical protein
MCVLGEYEFTMIEKKVKKYVIIGCNQFCILILQQTVYVIHALKYFWPLIEICMIDVVAMLT